MSQASARVGRAVLLVLALRVLYVWAAGGGTSPLQPLTSGRNPAMPLIKTDPVLEAIALGDSGRTSESEGALRSILLKTENAAARNALGILYFKQNETAKALEEFDHAVKDDPALADAFFNRATVRQGAGDNAGALADYARVIELKPQAPGMQQFAESEVARLKGADKK